MTTKSREHVTSTSKHEYYNTGRYSIGIWVIYGVLAILATLWAIGAIRTITREIQTGSSVFERFK